MNGPNGRPYVAAERFSSDTPTASTLGRGSGGERAPRNWRGADDARNTYSFAARLERGALTEVNTRCVSHR